MDSGEHTSQVNQQIILSKLDLMLTKADYAVEHGKLEGRVTELERRSIISTQWANDEHANIRRELNESYKTLISLIGTVKDDINNDRGNTMRWAVGIVISLLSGSGLATLIIEALHAWH